MWWNSCITANRWKTGFFNISSSPATWEQTSPCCYCTAEFQLSLSLWCVQEDSTVGGEDLPGLSGGQLASGPYQTHTVSFLQGHDQTEGHRASAATVTTGWSPVLTSRRPRWALQPVDAAVRHGQDSFYSVTLLCSQQAWNQVSTIQRYSKDPCRCKRRQDLVWCLILLDPVLQNWICCHRNEALKPEKRNVDKRTWSPYIKLIFKTKHMTHFLRATNLGKLT